MNLSRRRFLYLAGAAGATSAGALPRASAQAYPARPLRWIVGFPPGGGADIVSRIMAPWLAERIGQPVVIENKPGASSNISVQTVATSPPDGYTLHRDIAAGTRLVFDHDRLADSLRQPRRHDS